MTKKYCINVISDSAFTVQGHGVHTAYTEHLSGLKRYSELDIHTNQKGLKADITHIHTIGPYGLRFILGRHRLKFVSAHVTPDSFVGSLAGARLWYPLARWYLRWFYNKADGVFAVSQEVADQLKKMKVSKPVYVVPNMLDTSVFKGSAETKKATRKKLNIPKDRFVIVCSGQVQPRKRVDSFLEVAKALPQMQFIWIGGIPFKHAAADYKAMQRVMNSAPPNVTFTGVIKHKQTIPYYQASDVFFLPSEQETFGIVIIEGAAAGLPVLLRDNDQYKLTFQDWYLKASDDQGFIKILQKLSANHDFYLSACNKAQNIVNRYETKNVMDQINQIYAQALGESQ